MRHGVLLERLALAKIAEARVEALGAEPGIERDETVALASRPLFRVGKQKRPDPFPLPIFRHRHLAEL